MIMSQVPDLTFVACEIKLMTR